MILLLDVSFRDVNADSPSCHLRKCWLSYHRESPLLSQSLRQITLRRRQPEPFCLSFGLLSSGIHRILLESGNGLVHVPDLVELLLRYYVVYVSESIGRPLLCELHYLIRSVLSIGHDNFGRGRQPHALVRFEGCRNVDFCICCSAICRMINKRGGKSFGIQNSLGRAVRANCGR